MKNFKTGFSLAEVLIALAIVSVIATMCFSIAKKSIDRAYDMYVYTGYKGLSAAISDANNNNIYINQDQLTTTNDFITHIAGILSATKVESSGSTLSITAPNNIKYGLKKAPPATQKDDDGNVVQQIVITMQVPAKKKSSSGPPFEVYNLFYVPDRYGGNLVPYTNLAERRDLLLFYVDNGISGRSIQGNYTKLEYYSAKEAFCRAYGNLYGGNIPIIGISSAPLGSCSSYTVTGGTVRVADPRKG